MASLGDLNFPATAGELSGMSNAHLAGLIKKLPNAGALHPNIKSLAALMPKAEQVKFLSWHQYGVGSAEAAASAQAVAEGKYAAHLAKLAAKKGGTPTAPAPTTGKAAGAVNCAATLGSQIAQATQLSKAAQLLGDFGKASKLMLDDGDINALGSWRYSLKKLAQEAEAGGYVDASLDEVELLFALDAPLKALEDAAKLRLSADNSIDYIENLFGGKGVYAQTKKAMNTATGAADELVGLVADAEPHLKPLLDPVVSLAQDQGAKALATRNKVSLKNLNVSSLGQGIPQDLSTLSETKLITILAQVVEEGHPGEFLTPGHMKAYDNVLESIVQETKLRFSVPDVSADKLEQLSEVLSDLKAKTYFGLNVDVAVSETFDAVTETLAAATQAAIAVDITEAVTAYKAKTAAELKKLAAAKAEELGYPKSLGASYMDKNVAASFLAKADAGWDVGEEIAVAQAKYAGHQAKQAAKLAPDNAKVPGSQVPDFQATPTAATTTTKDEAAKLAALKGDPEAPASIFKPDPDITPDATLASASEVKSHKPAQVSHTWTEDTYQKHLGGGHRKATFTDENGDTWLWKIADTEGVAQGEVLGHEIGWELGFDMADIRYAPNFQVKTHGGTFKHGTIQKFHKGVKGDLNDIGGVAALTEDQIRELQEHQVFDWLISQHDTHGENLLLGANGRLIPIDKGQAFKFFGADELSTTYKPSGNFGQPVYNQLWARVEAGSTKVDFDAIDEILSRIEGISDKRFLELVQPYVKQRVADGGRSLSFLPAELRSESALINALLERKRGIRQDFTEFYQGIAKRAGIKWEPKWAQRAKAAAEVADDVKPAVSAGITTPLTKEFAEEVVATNAAGKALHLAGEEITYGQALAWTEEGVSGETILRLELRLERQADARLVKLFKDEVGDTAGLSPNFAAAPGEPEYSAILAGVKTVNTHAADGAYNATTLKKMDEVYEDLVKKPGLAMKATNDLHDGKITLEQWAEAWAEAEQADAYAKMVEGIKAAKAAGTKTSPTLVQKVDFDALKAKNLANPPPGYTPPVQQIKPQSLFVSKPTITNEVMVQTDRTDGLVAFKRTSDKRRPISGSFQTSHSAYRGEIDVDGTIVRVHYTGHSMSTSIPHQGLLDLEVVGAWDGSQETIEKVLRAVNRLGVDTKLATETDEALTYWRIFTRSMKESREYAAPAEASGVYTKLKATVDGVEQRIASAGNLTAEQETEMYREAWRSVFGDDAVRRAPERILHATDLRGRTTGYGHIERFDVPDDLEPLFTKNGKKLGLSHGIQDHNFDSTSLVDRHGTAAGQDLSRFGTYGTRTTTSMDADMRGGGGTGVYFSHGYSHWQSGRIVVISNPKARRRVSTYAFQGDGFGKFALRTDVDPLAGTNFTNPAEWVGRNASSAMRGANETTLRNGVHFGDEMELVFVRSNKQRQEVIESLHAEGITEIRGLPVEQRILLAKTDQDVIDKTDAYFRANPDLYRRSYANDAGLATKPVPTTTTTSPPQTASQKLASANPSANVTPTTAAAPGPLWEEAADKVWELQQADEWLVANSVAKKADLAAKKFNYQFSATQMKKEFKEFMQLPNAGKGLGYNYNNLSALPQYKQFDAYLHHKVAQLQLDEMLADVVTAEAKLDILITQSNSAAKDLALESIFGKSSTELKTIYYGSNPKVPYDEWLKVIATAQDGGVDMPQLWSALANANPPAAPVATATSTGAKVGKMAVGEKADGIPSFPLTDKVVGAKVHPPTAAEKVWGYKMGGKKVNVVYSKGMNTTNAVVEYEGEWFLLAKDVPSYTPKETVFQQLKDLGYPGLPETL